MNKYPEKILKDIKERKTFEKNFIEKRGISSGQYLINVQKKVILGFLALFLLMVFFDLYSSYSYKAEVANTTYLGSLLGLIFFGGATISGNILFGKIVLSFLALFYCLGAYFCLHGFLKMCENLSDNEFKFNYFILKNLEKIALGLVILFFSEQVASIAFEHIEDFIPGLISSLPFRYPLPTDDTPINYSLMIFSFFLFILSKLIENGIYLQEESEGTI